METNLDHLAAINDTEELLEADVAPIELITKFLITISEENMVQALQLASEILVYEPNNLMILEYRKALAALIQQTEGNWPDEISVNSTRNVSLTQNHQQKLQTHQMIQVTPKSFQASAGVVTVLMRNLIVTAKANREAVSLLIEVT